MLFLTYCLFSLPITEKDADSNVFWQHTLYHLSVSGSSVSYFSNHESFVPNHVGPLSCDFFLQMTVECTKKLGFKNIFNEEYKLYQSEETYEYIFSKYK